MSAAQRSALGGIVRGSWRRRFTTPAFSVQSHANSYHYTKNGALNVAMKCNQPSRIPSVFRGGATRQFSSKKHVDVFSDNTLNRAYIAVGSNLGDRFGNIASALELLCDSDWQPSEEKGIVRLVQTSYLHETAPMYMTDQPQFLNGVVEVVTNLSPHALLRRIKNVEQTLGRDFDAVRNGPRPVDLDIVLYETRDEENDLVQLVMDTPDLMIPHPGIKEREFVLKPLCELIPEQTIHPVLNTTVSDLLGQLRNSKDAEEECSVRVLPLPRGRMLQFNETIIMGILNVTPDSFSDGGKLKGSVEIATETALQMEQDGAGIIDVGGESTRPGAKEVLVEEEIMRTIPVIREVRKGGLREVFLKVLFLFFQLPQKLLRLSMLYQCRTSRFR